jgi:hypothetical protein
MGRGVATTSRVHHSLLFRTFPSQSRHSPEEDLRGLGASSSRDLVRLLLGGYYISCIYLGNLVVDPGGAVEAPPGHCGPSCLVQPRPHPRS